MHGLAGETGPVLTLEAFEVTAATRQIIEFSTGPHGRFVAR
jgi:hypothetical protein